MRRPFNRIVLGLDLSLTAPAAVVLGPNWEPGRWTGSLDSMRVNVDEAERGANRLRHIRDELMRFVRHDYGFVTHAFVEEYSFTSRTSHLASLGELGGVVKVMLKEEFGLEVEPVPAASARKTLLGTIKRKALDGAKVKDYVNHQLAQMGGEFPTMDEGDAFVIANHGRMLLGLSHVSTDTA